MTKKILIFDPALEDNYGNLSRNLGDLIISESITKVINDIFIDNQIIRVSSHKPFPKELLKKFIDFDYIILGGSNLLSSNLLKYNQWNFFENPSFLDYIFSKRRNIIMFGVGWWQYQESMDLVTKLYYSRVFSDSAIHSVRDEYTRSKLVGLKKKVINTSCPTLWSLHNKSSDRIVDNKSILFTLTDYNKNIQLDTTFINILLNFYKSVYFFPQGFEDEIYLKSLDIFKKQEDKFIILDHDYLKFVDFLHENKKNIDFIGTRLHCGIKCISLDIQTLILAIDNRAMEIHNDVNIPVVSREDFTGIENWILGKNTFGKIKLNLKNIKDWKSQFQIEN